MLLLFLGSTQQQSDGQSKFLGGSKFIVNVTMAAQREGQRK